VWKAAASFAVLLLIATRTAADDSAIVTPLRIGRADAPHKLTLWAQQDYSHLAANPEVSAVFTDIFEQWARAHPDVQIEVSVMPALELHKAKLVLAAAAGRLPDIASVDSFWMPLFFEGNHVQPLDPYWPAEDRADFLPFTTNTLTGPDGHLYGMWHGTDCRVLYYRKDLVTSPPQTWDELLATASRIAHERGISGYLYNAGRWEAAVFDHLPMFWAQGGELVDAGGNPVFGAPPNRERLINLLRFLRATIDSGASPRAVLANNDYQQLTSAAAAGDVAMFLGGSWQLRDLERALSPSQFDQWEISDVPQAEAGQQVTGVGGWVWVTFSHDPVKQRIATEFLRWIESPANVARISVPARLLPVRRSVYRDFPVFRENRWYARFGEMLTTARARPAVPIYPAISEQLQLAVGTAVAGTKTPEAAADDAWTAVRRIAERNRARAAQPPPTVDLIAAVPPIGSVLVLLVLLGVIGRRSWPLAVWLAPALALVSAFLLYPVLDLVRLAFTDARTAGPGYTYGLQTLLALTADSEFRAMVIVTVVFVAACVILQLGVGLAIALLIDAAVRRRIGGTTMARVAVVSAWVVPGVLVGVLWRILLMENRAGIASYLLSFVGVATLPFLSSATTALGSLIVANVWRGCAFSMILQYAGLQRIPRELHEAAALEGAGPWHRLRLVILPQILPVIALNAALITIGTLNTFDLVMPLTGGGPGRSTEVISLYMYRSAFFALEAGRAAGVATIMLALNVGLAAMSARLLRPRMTE
jgi:ABC-type sugar transport system permease subunit/ABC-type glycerol-3-phosphate transport system substrate-binding protein